MVYNLLLYPQTFLGLEEVEKIIKLVEKLLVLDLSITKENWFRFIKDHQNLQQKVQFLSFKPDLGIDLEELKKEVSSLEEWGYNFRNLENLKYFSQFKEVLEESLKEIFYSIKGDKVLEEEKVRIKSSIINLFLAEKLDVSMYEIKKELEKLEWQYHQVFKEKVIGEDFSFKPIEDLNYLISTSLSFPEKLPNLKQRIKAWQAIGPYIDFGSHLAFNGLVINSSELLELWQEKHEHLVKNEFEDGIKLYEFKTKVDDLLGFSVSLEHNSSTSWVMYLLDR
ncbi:hypothetical protein F1847_04360 [Thermodesulfobacterium sp. TA1]|uniref:hypothetical protein n=1 Tax=Thermodesulfobacterium sp. TA1 TaxID=2234087 RepID=UPI001231C485|nr:hypothetical protein [Thermodesulfobacterium sp. TA1]QER42017.1 hypothetical protein F1847_04360 [Thermodesulfobacterium sp. TA1]